MLLRLPNLQQRLAQLALALWMPTVALGVGSLMVGHWAPLPGPDLDPGGRLASGLNQVIVPALNDTDWALVHILYSECGCSRRVVQHLLDPDRDTGVREVVVLVGPDTKIHQALRSQGFKVQAETQAGLEEHLGITAAPLFLVVRQSAANGPQVAFAGGYTRRKQGLAFEDIHILDQLRRNGPQPSPIPVFGCGVSTALQSAIDPLRLKY